MTDKNPLRINEFDAFILCGLTFLFTLAIWGIDVSIGAILSGGYVQTISGPWNPIDYYHQNMIMLFISLFSFIGWMLLKINYEAWKYEKKGKH